MVDERAIARVVVELVHRFNAPYQRVIEAHHRAGHISALELDQVNREVGNLLEDVERAVAETLLAGGRTPRR